MPSSLTAGRSFFAQAGDRAAKLKSSVKTVRKTLFAFISGTPAGAYPGFEKFPNREKYYSKSNL
jgi:hypothetical protein